MKGLSLLQGIRQDVAAVHHSIALTQSNLDEMGALIDHIGDELDTLANSEAQGSAATAGVRKFNDETRPHFHTAAGHLSDSLEATGNTVRVQQDRLEEGASSIAGL